MFVDRVRSVVEMWLRPQVATFPEVKGTLSSLERSPLRMQNVGQMHDAEIKAEEERLRSSIARICRVCTSEGKQPDEETCRRADCPLRSLSPYPTR